MKQILTILILVFPFLTTQLFAQTESSPRYMRRPAISPNGQWIAFEYQGDIFKVSATGGRAIVLTRTGAYENQPVWNSDGSKIAFASDQYGNFDIYVMDANGGGVKRLTFNSAADIPLSFSNDDQSVLFGTARNDVYTSVRFPIPSLFLKLYRVPVNGGRSVMINSAGMSHMNLSRDGSTIIFQNRKGYESPQRKHEHASVTPDIWTYNLKTKKYNQLTTYNGDNLEPVWAGNGSYYFLSDRDGNLNVFKASINSSAKPVAVTHFKKNPVRGLSISDDGTLAFTQGGKIYTQTSGSKPKPVNITLTTDFANQATKMLSVSNKQITEMAVSPDSAEVAFVYRGDIFVTSVNGSTTKRLTDTPYQERMITFGPKGHTLYYSVEDYNFDWDIYKKTIANDDEPYFYAATVIDTRPVVDTDQDEFQPVISPDGKKMAYLENRNILKVYNFDTQKTVTVIPKGVNYSYSDGDQYYTWSPDSRWILANSGEGKAGLFVGRSQVDLIRADGSGKRINLTESGFGNYHPEWVLNGKAMIWGTSRDGLKNMNRGGQGDVYIMFFNEEAWNRFNLSKQGLALKKREEKKKKDDGDKKKEGKEVKKLQLNLKNLRDRTKRLTLNSSRLSDFLMSDDGETLYYLANYDGKYNLWETHPRTHKTKILAHLNSRGGGGIAFSTDRKTIFVLAGGRINKVDVSSGKVSPLKISARMKLDPAGEREYILGHAWAQVKDKLLYPDMHGVDWNYYYNYYKKFLPYISNNYDFCNLLSELLGELNVSHTGCRYHADFDHPDRTASLGMLYKLKKGGDGLVVKVILDGGPMDNARTKVKPNDVLTAINGTKITGSFDWAKLLNHKAGVYTRLTFHDPQSDDTWDEVIKPISKGKEGQLMYKRWLSLMQAKADSISNGTIGYVHVRGMNESSYRHVFGRVLGENANKNALVVDTRFNGGGWLHDKLATFLSGKLYLKFAPQGKVIPGGESLTRWTKPSDVIISQSNYSDAFIFPFIYKELGLGKLIGMPVPGTGTAVWWERQIDPTLVFGIPMIGTKVPGSDQFTENNQLEPDIKVRAPYSDILHGKDPQLKKAVEYLMKIASQGN